MYRYLKYGFFAYVILLAGFVSYKSVLLRSFGETKVYFVEPTQNCYNEGPDWRFCVHQSTQSRKDSLLYVFHAMGQDENFWMQPRGYASLLQKEWESKGMKPPTVVTVSFGPTWLVTPIMSAEKSGLLDRFRFEVFQAIEDRIGSPKTRMLLGESMGGLNVISIAMAMPDQFKKVAALCPPMSTFSPFASFSQIYTQLFKSNANLKSIFKAIAVGRSYFANEEEWNQFSPIARLKKNPELKMPTLYLSAGMRDQYGSFTATEAFANAVKETGVKVFWRPSSGDHCAVDAASLSSFFER